MQTLPEPDMLMMNHVVPFLGRPGEFAYLYRVLADSLEPGRGNTVELQAFTTYQLSKFIPGRLLTCYYC